MAVPVPKTGYPVAPKPSLLPVQGFGNTERTDAWWLEPLLVLLAFALAGAYSTWAALQGNNFEWGPYMSPLYASPFTNVPFSPALILMWIPIGFRATCYFYRRCYHRVFFGNPPACAVSGICTKYEGESKFPFILNNLHRYFLYLALVLVVLHWFHAIRAFNFEGQFGVGVGSLVILADTVLLSLYVFSCHSWRHWIGGKIDKFSNNAFTKLQHKAWARVTILNESHGLWAWLSLGTVCLADYYVRLVASGALTDVRFF
jgi:hypothetical protein